MASLVTVSPGTVLTNAEEVYAFGTSNLSTLQVGINVAAVGGTSPSLQAYLEVLGTDGVWYPVWKPAAITAASQVVAGVGPGLTNGAVLSYSARVRLELTGTTPSFTLSLSVHGR
jgi:hypothetical protein